MPRPRGLAACGALACALTAPAAHAQSTPAPTKVECAKMNADAQASRMTGKLSAARKLLAACQSAACPALVRDDCATRLDELEHAQPTVVFDVKDPSGADVSAVTVTIDGAPFTERLQGGALRVDPGEHTFTFATAGQPAVSRRLVIKEGEKDRREQVVLGPATVAPPAATATPPAPAPAEPASTPPTEPSPAESPAPGLGTMKILGLAVGGLGIASIAVGGVFGVMTLSAVSAQNSDCGSGSGCANRAQALSDHSTASTDGTISTVAFIAGGALLVGGAVLFLTAPSSPSSPESSRLLFAPSVGAEGAGLTVRGSF